MKNNRKDIKLDGRCRLQSLWWKQTSRVTCVGTVDIQETICLNTFSERALINYKEGFYCSLSHAWCIYRRYHSLQCGDSIYVVT